MSLADIVETVRAYHPQKVILFGSHARGNATEESDYDLLIIKETKKRPVDRVGDVLGIFGLSARIDPIVYTPEEFQKAQEDNLFFVQQVLEEGKVIYEQ